MPEGTVNHRILLIGHTLHEVTVVRNHQQGAGPGIEQILHCRQHIGIQVI